MGLVPHKKGTTRRRGIFIDLPIQYSQKTLHTHDAMTQVLGCVVPRGRAGRGRGKSR